MTINTQSLGSSTVVNDNDIRREIRFAVVMYGGISLAIYINGVTQELLNAVCATSPRGSDAAPTGSTVHVYRKLACLLSDEALLDDYRAWTAREPADASSDPLLAYIRQRNPLHTRIIVDIISGTSAGGINGIYLAKALTNDQALQGLKQLWLDEADFELLINDRRSLAGLVGRLKPQNPPKSLLNSRRMYHKLLAALEAMDDKGHSVSSPHVDELDLFITTTDIEGSVVPIQLSDRVVFERRHRSVFHLRYTKPETTGQAVNDFTRDCNPFLAFAARCTSSFPFAFEPMRLRDIDEALGSFNTHRDRDESHAGAAQWRRYFGAADGLDTSVGDDHLTRPFGDGGYLDNKPFSYATRLLTRRHADVPVDRKLIYVEPSPEHPEQERNKTEDADWPDVLDNVSAALLGIPTHETIREDLELVLQRNRRITRVRRITQRVEEDIDHYLASSAEKRAPEWLRVSGSATAAWDDRSLSDIIEIYGPFYLPYRRLRVGAATDQIAENVTTLTGFNGESDHFYAVRSLVRAWRDSKFVDEMVDHAADATRPRLQTSNRFLNEFDLQYRVRRLQFLRRKASALASLVDKLAGGRRQLVADERKLIDSLNRHQEQQGSPSVDLMALDAAALHALKVCIREVLKQLNQCNCSSRIAQREVRTGGEHLKEYVDAAQSLELRRKHIAFLLGVPWEDAKSVSDHRPRTLYAASIDASAVRDSNEGITQAQALFNEPSAFELPEDFRDRFDNFLLLMGVTITAHVDALREHAAAVLDPQNSELAKHSPAARAALAFLWQCYLRFEVYDQISFPILFDSDAEEADLVEIVRISPEDATSLIDEQNPAERRRKLAGTSLHHFGAFLDRAWRKNDMMWGRLDGAERLIDTLLPGTANRGVRSALLLEAQQAILSEEMSADARAEFVKLIGAELFAYIAVQDSTPELKKITVRAILERVRAIGRVDGRLEEVLTASLQPGTFLEYLKQHYDVDRNLDPKSVLRNTTRSVRVTGRLLNDAASRREVSHRAFSWVASIGGILSGIVELALPESIWILLATRWLSVLYAFEFIVILGATLLSSESSLRFGWSLFGLTAGVHAVVILLNEYMRGRRRPWKWVVVSVALIVLATAALGIGLMLDAHWALTMKQFM